jgi:hypothetical protein
MSTLSSSGSDITLTASDIQIGAAEIKNATDDTRAIVNASGEVLVKDTTADTALAIMDDWDETDRAKVNIIAGQVGVAAGSGAVSALTQRVILATDDPAVTSLAIMDDWDLTDTCKVTVADTTIDDYETVAASQTAQVLGATGATGDFINHLLVVPANLNPGAISILDNATSITVFTGGAASISSLTPFTVYLGMKSVSGAWKVTTGADVSVIGVGKFT